MESQEAPVNKLMKMRLYSNILTSQSFTFLIGPEKKPIVVHSNVFEDSSPPLHALINNGMRETNQREAVLEHVELDVFSHLVEFIYNNDVMDVRTITTKGFPENAPDAGAMRDKTSPMPECSDCGSQLMFKQCSCCWGSKPGFVDFKPDKYPFTNLKQPEWSNADNQGNFVWFDVLAYAKLFLLAHEYLVASVQDYCLFTIAVVSNITDASTIEVENFIDAIVYIFNNTTEEKTDSRYPIREIITFFAAAQSGHLMAYKAFQELIQEHGEFALALVKMMQIKTHIRKTDLLVYDG